MRQGASKNPDRAGETASGRQRKSPSNTAIQIQDAYDDDWLAGRVVAITQLAAELDRQTLQLALRIVPVQWWAARLGDAHLDGLLAAGQRMRNPIQHSASP